MPRRHFHHIPLARLQRGGFQGNPLHRTGRLDVAQVYLHIVLLIQRLDLQAAYVGQICQSHVKLEAIRLRIVAEIADVDGRYPHPFAVILAGIEAKRAAQRLLAVDERQQQRCALESGTGF